MEHTDLPPPFTFFEVKRFFEEHSGATKLLRVATQDYAASRCLLLNGLFPGLVLGAQAIEKFLKAYLLFNDPNLKVRGLSHSLPDILKDTGSLFPQLQLSRFAPLVEKFVAHYAARYPDNPDGSISKTTADLFELDPFVVFLNENMPCPRNVKYRTGFYERITFSLEYMSTVPPEEFWIKHNNRALAPLLPRIAADYVVVMKELYPELR
ncbi:MAG: hypothetical protein HYS06_11135 [Methylocystis sp.]|nr:hypothetical protein [Methylocystis sp.]